MKKPNPLIPWKVTLLPPPAEIETRTVLKTLPAAHRALAELKGIASTIPNEAILLNTLGLQEAKESSAIENIITTGDELYKAELEYSIRGSVAAKEVRNYTAALKKGNELIKKNGLITSNHILKIQSVLEQNNAGFRKVPGTVLKNSRNGKVVFTPPQEHSLILKAMSNLVNYINDETLSDADVLVKMAVIHYQFESIHPFFDGNGRTGRIINVLYLVQNSLLNQPILYLSRYINRNKDEYYRLLQTVREEGRWEPWLLFMIEGVRQTALETTELIIGIRELMMEFKHRIRSGYKFYSQELINNLFKHPYTKIEFIQDDLKVSRITAANYLNLLSADGLLTRKKLGTGNYYINTRLFDLLSI